MKGFFRIATLLTMVLTFSCANPYAQFYTDLTGGRPREMYAESIEVPTECKIYSGSDMRSDYDNLIEDGYFCLGYTSFNGAAASTTQAKFHAKTIGAELVLVYSEYTNTVTGTTPLTLKNPSQTSTSRTTGTLYGSGGSVNYNSRTTTTSPGGYTTYDIPYNTNRYDYFASYWVKGKPLILGINGSDLNESLRADLQRNRGVEIVRIINGTPAYKNDLLIGDVLISINNIEIDDMAHLTSLLKTYSKQKVTFDIIRSGVHQLKEIALN